MNPQTPAPCPAPPPAAPVETGPLMGCLRPWPQKAATGYAQRTWSRWGREGGTSSARASSVVSVVSPEGPRSRPIGWEEPSAQRGGALPTPGATALTHACVGRAHRPGEQDTPQAASGGPAQALTAFSLTPNPTSPAAQLKPVPPGSPGPLSQCGAQAHTLCPAWAGARPRAPIPCLHSNFTTTRPRLPSPGGNVKTTNRNCPRA